MQAKTKSSTIEPSAPASEELARLDAWWRAANYLSVGQIYLLDNPLLATPLKPEHIKPRLLGHWGTTPGLNFIYAHLNRVINKNDLDMLYIAGPGHGGPALVANTWLEGSYSEFYPNIARDAEGMQRLFRQFSFPGGIGSHVTAETPGSIHEGGELGYALSHAFGAAFDNPELIVACVIGWRGRDRAARGRVAFEQVPQPGRRRRGAADPASQRLQDRQPHGAGAHPACGTRSAAHRLWLPAVLRRGFGA